MPMSSEMLNFARFSRIGYRTALEKKKDTDRKNASGARELLNQLGLIDMAEKQKWMLGVYLKLSKEMTWTVQKNREFCAKIKL